MKPDWLGCLGCLFFWRQVNVCKLNPETVEKDPDAFCYHWVCVRCWRSWDTKSAPAVFVDHSRCKEAVFG